MAKWTNYYRLVEPKPIVSKVTDNQTIGDQGAYGNFSWYQRLVQGSASRLTRYREYDLMDNDVEVARALDTIAEEMLGNQPKSNEPLIIEVDTDKEESIKNTTVMTLKTALKYWSKTHDWHNKLFNVARATVKYGDCFFEKKKEKPDKKWEYIHPKNVVGALVDNEDITKVLGWQIKRDTKEVRASYGVPVSNTSSNIETEIVPDNQIVRFTLNDDMSDAAPFGDSVLGPVYRSHKQKELLEDSVLIYRIQRAPERRAFYIDVGKMPPMRVKTYLEQFKNEIKQKRVPNIHGGQSNVDSVYNPQSMCLALDTKIPLLDGRTLSLNELIEEYDQGKENWVYSIDPETGDVVPGPISWAGITRKDADTIKLILDNGEEIVCTPDHKFPVQGKGFLKAEELTPDDSLWPFNVKKAKISTKDKETSGVYSKVYNPATKGWKYVHRLVANYMKEKNEHNEFVFNEEFVEKEKRTIHHANFSSLDNSPNNLVFMNHEDHVRYHKSFDINQEVKFSIGLFERFEQIANENLNIKFKDLMFKLNEDKIFMGIYAKINLPEKRTSKIKSSNFRQKIFLKFMKNFGYKNWRDYRNKKMQSRINVDNIVSYNGDEIKLLQFVIRLVKEVSVHNFAIVNYLKSNSGVWKEFRDLYDLIKDESKPGHYQKLTVPEAGMLERISKYFGYKSFKHLVNESANFNHRVVRIEKGTKQDTGTLTIDKEEKYHNYHTFAIDFNGLGVFVRNSEDFFFAQRSDGKGTKVETLPGGCIDLSTEIPLLDGRTLPLNDLIEEHKQGKENWVYSVNPSSGEIVPGIVSWAGITKENAEVYELELDNGEKIVATPDHKFPVWGKGKVKCKDLEENDSIISFNTREHFINSQSKYDYTQVYDHKDKEWKFVHRVVRNFQDKFDGRNELTYEEKYQSIEKDTIHHLNYNRFDNTPSNLIWMSYKDHWCLHSNMAKRTQPLATKAASEKYHSNEEYRKRVDKRLKTLHEKYQLELNNNPRLHTEYCNKVSNGIKNYIYALDNEGRENRANNSRKNFLKGSNIRLKKQATDLEFKKDVYSRSGETLSKRLSEGGDLRQQCLEHMDRIRTCSFDNQSINFSPDMMTIVKYLFDEGYIESAPLVEKLNHTKEFVDLWNFLNTQMNGKIYHIGIDKFKHHHLDMLLKVFGYKNWNDFKEQRLCTFEIKEDEFKKKTEEMSLDEVNFFKFIVDLTKRTAKVFKLCKIINDDNNLKTKFIEMYYNTISPQRRNIKSVNSHHFNEFAQYFNYKNFKHFLEDKLAFNHRVVSVRKLNDRRTVGTITVDQEEKYHSYHNFACKSLVFLKNSGLGELSDLEYFQKKVWRGLRIPTSYMTEGAEGAVWNDGKVGTAYILELRFSLYIMRLQAHIEVALDREFKNYLRRMNIIIDESIYKVRLPEPSNFGTYRQQEVDAALLGMYGTADGIPYLSKRFIMSRYLQLSDEEIIENERMLREEKGMEADAKTKQELTMIYGMPGPEEMGGGAAPGMTAPPPGVPGPEAGGAPPPPGGEAGGGETGGAV